MIGPHACFLFPRISIFPAVAWTFTRFTKVVVTDRSDKPQNLSGLSIQSHPETGNRNGSLREMHKGYPLPNRCECLGPHYRLRKQLTTSCSNRRRKLFLRLCT